MGGNLQRSDDDGDRDRSPGSSQRDPGIEPQQLPLGDRQTNESKGFQIQLEVGRQVQDFSGGVFFARLRLREKNTARNPGSVDN